MTCFPKTPPEKPPHKRPIDGGLNRVSWAKPRNAASHVESRGYNFLLLLVRFNPPSPNPM